MTSREQVPPSFRAPEFVAAAGFLNTSPFSLQALFGQKVLLLNFWTLGSINCLRTLPHLNAWYEKYHRLGLEIIGLHAPEFEFEKKDENVAAAVNKFNIDYPVVLDNEHGTWNAYHNRYWPRQYLIDVHGNVVYDKIGEGDYEASERKIQELLKERLSVLGINGRVPSDLVRPRNLASANHELPLSSAIYLGAARNDLLQNGPRCIVGEQHFQPPAIMNDVGYYLLGHWRTTLEYAENISSGAGLVLKYHAAKVFVTAGSTSPRAICVKRDAQQLSTVRGRDIEADSTLTIHHERLYRIIEDPDGYGDHLLEIEVTSPGLRIYTLAFG